MESRSRSHLAVGLVALSGWSMTLAGCAALNRTEATPEDLARAVPVVEPVSETAPEPVPTTGELIGPDDPDIQAAMNAWKANGQAPIIRKDEFVQYPYGLTEAIVTCKPLRVCDIELEAGEEALSVSLGDSSRWLASPAFSGDGEGLTPHVLVKPTELGMATNAAITTTRRTYYPVLSPTTDAAHA